MSESQPCCAVCGFFVRRSLRTGDLVPCTQDHRGWMGFDPYDGTGMPCCGKGAHDLEAEWRRQLARLQADPGHGGNVHAAAVSAVTCDERSCAAFRPWDPLRSPQEHEDLAFAERIEAAYRQQRAEDLARFEKFHEDQRRWHQEIESLTRHTRWLAVAALIISAVALIALGVLALRLGLLTAPSG